MSIADDEAGMGAPAWVRSASEGAKTTLVPTAAAPANLLSSVRVPVETEVSMVPVLASYTPITSDRKGANTTLVPTTAEPRNLAWDMVTLSPTATEAVKVPGLQSVGAVARSRQ